MNISPQTLGRLAAPKQFEDQFMMYLQKAGANITQSKTIAGFTFYDQKVVGGSTIAEFFTGTPDSQRTNLNSFTRPESEHVLITAIRVAQNTTGITPGTPPVWSLGTTGSGQFENSYMTITNNNVVMMKEYPLAESLANLTTIDNGLIILEQPILWQGQTDLKIEVKNPVAAFSTTAAIRFELIGIGLI